MKKQANYFLNHSVGLPFDGAEQHFQKRFFQPWHNENEPWPHWLAAMDNFRDQLAILINGQRDDICPQANLSSALSKVLYSLPKPHLDKNIILLSEEDFPSMAFVLKKAESLGYRLVFIPQGANLQDLGVWQSKLGSDVALCFITQVQSNNGRQLPVADIVTLCREQAVLSFVDVAQSIGLLAVNVGAWQADFVLGSCVKWLCGGPGAGFLWVNPKRLNDCQPVDVGWFSHDNPFEFDIHHFDYHQTALRFWGGTPAVMSHINAAYAIEQVLARGINNIRQTNLSCLKALWQAVPNEFIRSPIVASKCSGTAIVHFGEHQQRMAEKLKNAGIAFDQRETGFRLSPHYYTKTEEMDYLVEVFNGQSLSHRQF